MFRSAFLRYCQGGAAKASSPRLSNAEHGGIPLGALILDAVHIEQWRDLVRRSLRRKLTTRGVEPFFGPRNQSSLNQHGGCEGHNSSTRLMLIHLPTSVATALDDGHPELVSFLKSRDGVYLPGLRRSPANSEAIRKKRSANIPPYVQYNRPKSIASKQTSFTFVELFAGIGGFRLGLESLGGHCVFANEIDPYAASIYRRYFDASRWGEQDRVLVEADILDIRCAEIPFDVSILTGGFPCQPFSARGKQGGLSDERGQLYRELVRILKSCQPKSFIFENVLGLVNMREGENERYRGHGLRTKRKEAAGPIFQIILKAFEECGYKVTWRVCNSRHYVAQHRERVFIVGIRDDIYLNSNRKFQWDWYEQILKSSSASCKKKPSGASLIVRDILESIDSPAVLEAQLSAEQWQKAQQVHTNQYGVMMARERARINLDSKAPTLISSYRRASSYTSKYVFEELDRTRRDIPRFLTPRECCRLMGFPDEFPVPSIRCESEGFVSHFYFGIGNAVVPPLVSDIGKELLQALEI